jgi:hypothetical protein
MKSRNDIYFKFFFQLNSNYTLVTCNLITCGLIFLHDCDHREKLPRMSVTCSMSVFLGIQNL